MLQVSAPVETPFGVVVANTVWRWTRLLVDLERRTAHVTVSAFVDAAAAAAFGTPGERRPLAERHYAVAGPDFDAVVARPAEGDTVSAVVSSAVYAYVRGADPFFAAAVELAPR